MIFGNTKRTLLPFGDRCTFSVTFQFVTFFLVSSFCDRQKNCFIPLKVEENKREKEIIALAL